MLAQLGLLIGVVLLAALIISSMSGGTSHRLRLQFASADQLAPGLEVRIAGRKVGDISAIRLVGRSPVVTIEITEGDVWPLPAGTTAEIRWGSTTSLEYRYIELHPGPRSAAPLPAGALLPESHNSTPVELDQFYRIFRGQATADLRSLVGELGDTLAPNGPALRSGLAAAPGGLDQTSAVLAELGADRGALAQLVRQGNDVTTALASRQADLGPLADNAAATFDTLARHTQAEQAALQQAPAALSQGVATLSRLDASLGGLQRLVSNVAPGAVALRSLAPTALGALRELFAVAPLATSALTRGTRAAGPLTSLLTTATPFLPRAGSALSRLAPMVGCVLPYGPEIAGTLSTWSGFNENYDSGGHYARTFPLTFNPLIVAGTPMSSSQIVGASGGGLSYAMPRPPGLNAGHPFFQPQCGAGPASLDASADPEAGG